MHYFSLYQIQSCYDVHVFFKNILQITNSLIAWPFWKSLSWVVIDCACFGAKAFLFFMVMGWDSNLLSTQQAANLILSYLNFKIYKLNPNFKLNWSKKFFLKEDKTIGKLNQNPTWNIPIHCLFNWKVASE